jgi:hypothetical protein
MIIHNGAGARWDAQSWMICTMDIANTAPIKAALVGDPAQRRDPAACLDDGWSVPVCVQPGE